MFLGQYHHNIDEKGRLTIPSRFREVLVAEGAYVLQGFDGNLMVLTSPVFETISRRLNGKSMTDPTTRLLRRMIYSSGDRQEVDRAGRILIPQYLRRSANLESEAVVVGAGQYFEIWSPERWAAQTALLLDSQTNSEHFAALDLASD